MKFMLSICTAVGLLAGGLAIHAIPPVRGDFPPPQDENNAAISGLSSSSSSSTSSGPEPQFAGASTIDLSDFHPEKNPEHKCVHDELLEKHGETIRAQQITLLPPPDDARSVRTEGNATGTMRKLQSNTYAPIRIRPVPIRIGSDSNVTPALVDLIVNRLMPETARRWGQLLSVKPVSGPLYAARQCQSFWGGTAPYRCASYSTTPPSCANFGDDEPLYFDATNLGPDPFWPTGPGGVPSYMPAGAGYPDSDFVVFVTAKQTSTCGPGGSGVLAYASTCQRGTDDRPTFARINLCPLSLDASPSSAKFEYQVAIAMHEMGHALGFSSDSLPLFRRPDGTPRTPRNPGYPFLVAEQYQRQVMCNGRAFTATIPAENTVQWFSERGMNKCAYPDGLAPSENCVHRVVTERVRAAAAFYFGCDSLPGPELENQDTSTCPIVGSHWEGRSMNGELMAAYASINMRITPATLAFFEDSGWYKANFAGLAAFRKGFEFGYKQGCDFATGRCLVPGSSGGLVGQGTPPHFYAENRPAASGQGMLCTMDRRGLGYVQSQRYPYTIPIQFQYYSNDPSRGGSPPTADYCPVVTPYSNLVCSVPANAASFGSSRYYGDLWGANSMCLESTLVWANAGPTGPGAGCYSVRCTSQNSLVIDIGANQSGASQTVPCGPGSGGVYVYGISGYNGAIVCPSPEDLCGTAERFGVAAGGVVPPTYPSASPRPVSLDPSESPSASAARSSLPSSSAAIPKASESPSTTAARSDTATPSGQPQQPAPPTVSRKRRRRWRWVSFA